MVNYERDDTLPVQTDGSLDFSDIATLLANDVEYLEADDLSKHAPTTGRVAKDLTSREFYVGDGSSWQLATDFISGKFGSINTDEVVHRQFVQEGDDAYCNPNKDRRSGRRNSR